MSATPYSGAAPDSGDASAELATGTPAVTGPARQAGGERAASAERSALPRLERRDVLFGAALFAIALLLRILVVQAFEAAPTWDGQFYHRGALSISEGHGYSEPAIINGQPGRLPWSHYPVGYSAFIGAVYALFAPSAPAKPRLKQRTPTPQLAQRDHAPTHPSAPFRSACSSPAQSGRASHDHEPPRTGRSLSAEP